MSHIILREKGTQVLFYFIFFKPGLSFSAEAWPRASGSEERFGILGPAETATRSRAWRETGARDTNRGKDQSNGQGERKGPGLPESRQGWRNHVVGHIQTDRSKRWRRRSRSTHRRSGLLERGQTPSRGQTEGQAIRCLGDLPADAIPAGKSCIDRRPENFGLGDRSALTKRPRDFLDRFGNVDNLEAMTTTSVELPHMTGPGVAVPHLPDVDQLAQAYITQRDQRLKCLINEIVAKDNLITALHSHDEELKQPDGSLAYRFADLVITLSHGKEKLKVEDLSGEAD